MFKYVMNFSKTGTICYTSHLDIMKVFKRAFKRAGIKLAYSQGFNPHPKMGFAQPLSLGYWGLDELIEFETIDEHDPKKIEDALKVLMPEGLELRDCRQIEKSGKTLAAQTVAAVYTISIPLEKSLGMTGQEIHDSYMSQTAITALKKQKKKKELAEVDIKPMIRQISFAEENEALYVTALLDSGSSSNLSPELVITTLLKHFDIKTERSEIQVMRKEIIFQ